MITAVLKMVILPHKEYDFEYIFYVKKMQFRKTFDPIVLCLFVPTFQSVEVNNLSLTGWRN